MERELIAKILQALLSRDEEQQKKLLDELSESNETEWERFLKFNTKEISKMPQRYRKLFRTNGLRAHIRKRKRGNSISYEVRCRMCDINITASATTVEEAKKRFIEKLTEPQKTKGIPTNFEKFLYYYFENFRKRKVTQETLTKDMSRVKRYLLPAFGKKELNEIYPASCQKLVDDLCAKEKFKTAVECYGLLSVIFKCAIAHNIISKSPLDIVLKPKCEHTHGTALTKQEEALLLQTAPKDIRESIAIILYTGMRPNEYETLERKGKMLIAKNSKRKNGKIEYKRIPICPMLEPYISETPTMQHYRYIERRYKKIFPEHKLYDMRTTFYTRCKECGVEDAARNEMIGHSSGELERAYTDLSDEYLIREASKIKYDLPPILSPNLPPN